MRAPFQTKPKSPTSSVGLVSSYEVLIQRVHGVTKTKKHQPGEHHPVTIVILCYIPRISTQYFNKLCLSTERCLLMFTDVYWGLTLQNLYITVKLPNMTGRSPGTFSIKTWESNCKLDQKKSLMHILMIDGFDPPMIAGLY